VRAPRVVLISTGGEIDEVRPDRHQRRNAVGARDVRGQLQFDVLLPGGLRRGSRIECRAAGHERRIRIEISKTDVRQHQRRNP